VETVEEARAFARDWIDAWNSHDLDWIMSHYAATVIFRSPRIAVVTGDKSCIVQGIENLRAYWSKALVRAPELHFNLEGVYVGKDAVTIAYRNHRGQNVAETLVFNAEAMVEEGIAAYM
jgi:ketosteroid isomerase-like protein